LNSGQGQFDQDGPVKEEYAEERKIEDLAEAQGWVSVIGTVISRDPSQSEILIDDGTGQAVARVPRMPDLGSLVRVVGRIFIASGEARVDAEILQDFSGFDVELYRKILQLEERVFRGGEDFHR